MSEDSAPHIVEQYRAAMDKARHVVRRRRDAFEDIHSASLEAAVQSHIGDDASLNDVQSHHLGDDDFWDTYREHHLDHVVEQAKQDLGLPDDYDFNPEGLPGQTERWEDIILEAHFGLSKQQYSQAVEQYKQSFKQGQRQIQDLTTGDFSDWLRNSYQGKEEVQRAEQEVLGSVQQNFFDQDHVEDVLAYTGADEHFNEKIDASTLGALIEQYTAVPEENRAGVAAALAQQTGQPYALEGEANELYRNRG
jgi:hypothetical protein